MCDWLTVVGSSGMIVLANAFAFFGTTGDVPGNHISDSGIYNVCILSNCAYVDVNVHIRKACNDRTCVRDNVRMIGLDATC